MQTLNWIAAREDFAVETYVYLGTRRTWLKTLQCWQLIYLANGFKSLIPTGTLRRCRKRIGEINILLLAIMVRETAKEQGTRRMRKTSRQLGETIVKSASKVFGQFQKFEAINSDEIYYTTWKLRGKVFHNQLQWKERHRKRA